MGSEMCIRDSAKLVSELTLDKNAPADIDTEEDLEEARKWIK